MDKDIEKMVKSCRISSLAAKATSIKFSHWSAADRRWGKLHVDFAGALNRFY